MRVKFTLLYLIQITMLTGCFVTQFQTDESLKKDFSNTLDKIVGKPLDYEPYLHMSRKECYEKTWWRPGKINAQLWSENNYDDCRLKIISQNSEKTVLEALWFVKCPYRMTLDTKSKIIEKVDYHYTPYCLP